MSWTKKAQKYTGVNIASDNTDTNKLRKEIIELSSKYFDLVHKKKNLFPTKHLLRLQVKFLIKKI